MHLGSDSQLQSEARHSFSHCIKPSMSKPPAPTIQSISANICWMKTSLYIQIPLELRWLQVQGWLSCPAEIHGAAPQLPCSIPGPHLRLSSTELLLRRVGLRRDPLSCCALSSAQPSQLSGCGCLPSQTWGMIQLRE